MHRVVCSFSVVLVYRFQSLSFLSLFYTILFLIFQNVVLPHFLNVSYSLWLFCCCFGVCVCGGVFVHTQMCICVSISLIDIGYLPQQLSAFTFVTRALSERRPNFFLQLESGIKGFAPLWYPSSEITHTSFLCWYWGLSSGPYDCMVDQFFLCCSDKILDKDNLEERGFILTSISMMDRTHSGKDMTTGRKGMAGMDVGTGSWLVIFC